MLSIIIRCVIYLQMRKPSPRFASPWNYHDILYNPIMHSKRLSMHDLIRDSLFVKTRTQLRMRYPVVGHITPGKIVLTVRMRWAIRIYLRPPLKWANNGTQLVHSAIWRELLSGMYTVFSYGCNGHCNNCNRIKA